MREHGNFPRFFEDFGVIFFDVLGVVVDFGFNFAEDVFLISAGIHGLKSIVTA